MTLDESKTHQKQKLGSWKFTLDESKDEHSLAFVHILMTHLVVHRIEHKRPFVPVDCPRTYKRARHETTTTTADHTSVFRTPKLKLEELVHHAQERIQKRPKVEQELFTLDQVRHIVREAVGERDRGVREEYDKILQALLQETFENFSRLNQDYVTRFLPSSRHAESYIS